jgi:hypothetical protein
VTTFVHELNRRNVFRVGAAYAVTAWLLIQVAETVFPLFGFDEAPARLVVTILAIGFIPALIVAWVYELTPQGLKKDRDVDRSQPDARAADRMRIPRQSGHRFHGKPATDSRANRPLIPGQAGRRFQRNPATVRV